MAGIVSTFTVAVTIQPVANAYEIVADPQAIPFTVPVDAPTDAMAGVLLVHVPPVVASDSVMVVPEHTFIAPVMAAGRGLMVVTAVVIQPVLSV